MIERCRQAARWLGAYLVTFTQTQLVITLISLPILVAWGLGYSVMSLVGNLLFSPVLTLFLILSSLLLATQLLGIPNAWLASLLNYLTAVWDWILNHGSPHWLIESAQPHALVLIAIPLMVYVVLRHRWISTPLRRLMALCSMLVMCYGIFYAQRWYNGKGSLARCLDEKFSVIKLENSNALIVIDRGYFARKKSIEKAISYEVRPWLAKQFGSVSIKELRITNVGYGGLKAAAYLCTILPVEALWLPFFKKKLSKSAWRAFFDMKRVIAAKKIRLVRYKDHRSVSTSAKWRPSKTH